MEYVGYKESVIDPTHWVFGAGEAWPIMRADRSWTNYEPKREPQNLYFETYNCTGFNTLNAVEAIMKLVYGIEVNYSDRWLGIVAGTKEGGNDPHTVMEAIRKNGLIPESMLPFSENLADINEYYSFKDADEGACRAAGQQWLATFDFNHDWVFVPGSSIRPEDKAKLIWDALQYSPVPSAVRAWTAKNNVYYMDRGARCNHWSGIYGQGQYEQDYDSYDPTSKNLAMDYDFGCAKRIKVTKRTTPYVPAILPIAQQQSILQVLIAKLLALLKK